MVSLHMPQTPWGRDSEQRHDSSLRALLTYKTTGESSWRPTRCLAGFLSKFPPPPRAVEAALGLSFPKFNRFLTFDLNNGRGAANLQALQTPIMPVHGNGGDTTRFETY